MYKTLSLETPSMSNTKAIFFKTYPSPRHNPEVVSMEMQGVGHSSYSS